MRALLTFACGDGGDAVDGAAVCERAHWHDQSTSQCRLERGRIRGRASRRQCAWATQRPPARKPEVGVSTAGYAIPTVRRVVLPNMKRGGGAQSYRISTSYLASGFVY